MPPEHKTNNRVQDAQNYIRQKIVNGEFPPGTHITETSLAEALGMSRGPVREALKTLESEGMVNHAANRGYRVVFLSPREAWEVFCLRGQLEKIALEMAGGRAGMPQLMKMESALDKMEAHQRRGEVASLVEWDDVFHQAIVECADMPRLTAMWQSLSPLNLSMFYSGLRAEVFDFSNQWEKHVELYETIARGDMEASVRRLLDHYLVTGKKIFKQSL